MSKIGIMGGTFDPIHNGHLLAAEEVRQRLSLDKIIFVPTSKSPLKGADVRASAVHRHAMCQLACVGNPHFFVDDVELNRDGTSFTVDTIAEMRYNYPHSEIFFIVGADVPTNFHKWKDFARILQLCTLVVTTRPGHKPPDTPLWPLTHVEITDMAISSTKIRELLTAGQGIRYMVPSAVAAYIAKEGLYCGLAARLRPFLERELSRPRYLHSLSVMEEAVKLGRHHGADAETLDKLRLAGLLHDCAKDITPGPQHATDGAIIAKELYGVEDADVLSAIALHTLGGVDMSFIDKVVYLADFIEPTREQDNAREEAARLAYEDIDNAMLFVLRHTIQINQSKGKTVLLQSLDALRHLEENYGKQ